MGGNKGPLSRRAAGQGCGPDPARAEPHRSAGVRALLPDGEQHRSLRAIEGHPVPWPGERSDLGGLLRARQHVSLGMLGCMRRCFDLLAEQKGVKRDLATVPPEDEATYEMIRNADTVGVFQIESRAQMAMLP